MIGASPRESSSARSTFGSGRGARQREHLLLAARAEAGAAVQDPLERREALEGHLGRHAASLRLSATVRPMITERSSVR